MAKKPQFTYDAFKLDKPYKARIEKQKPKDNKGTEIQKPKPKQQLLLKYAKSQPSTGNHSNNVFSSEEGNSNAVSDASAIYKQEKVCSTPTNDSEYTDDTRIVDEENQGVDESES